MDKKKVIKKLIMIAWISAFALLLVIYLYSSEQNRKQEAYHKALAEQEANQEAIEEETAEEALVEEEEEKIEIYEVDAFDLLNTSLKLFEKKAGLGKSIEDSDELFYESAGVYITADEEKDITGIRLEEGGKKEVLVSALGLFIGDSYKEAMDSIAEKGIESLPLSDESLMGSFYLGDKMDRLYSIVISSENNKISQIRVYSTKVE